MLFLAWQFSACLCHRELKRQDSTKVENCISFSSFTWRSFPPLLKHPDSLSGPKASAETSFQQRVPGTPRHRDLCQCQQLRRVTVLTLTHAAPGSELSERRAQHHGRLTPSYGKKRPVRRGGFPGAVGRPRVCPDRPHRSLCWLYISIHTSKVFQVKYGEGGKEHWWLN